MAIIRSNCECQQCELQIAKMLDGKLNWCKKIGNAKINGHSQWNEKGAEQERGACRGRAVKESALTAIPQLFLEAISRLAQRSDRFSNLAH